MTEDSADTSGHNIVLHMGHIDQLLGRKINKGDSLQKIARETGVSVDDLVSYNNIANANKIKAGQYIKIPPVGMRQPEEIVSTQELLAGDDALFRGDIGA
jgi:murein DD-endopeptidase MepM/ murein hydrolase activator NlpD